MAAPDPGGEDPPLESPTPYAAGHEALEAMFVHLLSVFRSGPAERVAEAWAAAEQVLLEHFETEERSVLSDLLAVRPREARVLLEEHSYLRRRLGQLSAALSSTTAEDARTFLDELRAHGKHEERVLYPWGDPGSPPDSPKPRR
jgi:hypothetical protein